MQSRDRGAAQVLVRSVTRVGASSERAAGVKSIGDAF